MNGKDGKTENQIVASNLIEVPTKILIIFHNE